MTETEEKPIPLADLYAEYDDLRKDLFNLADMLPDGDEFKAKILEGDQKIQDLRAGREAKVLECHPDGCHWPPHPECPLCQKVSDMWDRQAKERCKKLGLEETEENLEIALKDWLKEKAGK